MVEVFSKELLKKHYFESSELVHSKRFNHIKKLIETKAIHDAKQGRATSQTRVWGIGKNDQIIRLLKIHYEHMGFKFEVSSGFVGDGLRTTINLSGWD